ncbi:TonB-dependent siderophore receptor, partial [Pseudomonas aeruginosa]|nr:TonB-dependent siderophore receptor [Pseudomonas aeruginosa]
AAYKFKSIQRSLDANINETVRLYGLTHSLLGDVTYDQGAPSHTTGGLLRLLCITVNVYVSYRHVMPRPQSGQYTSQGTNNTKQKGLTELVRITLDEPLTLAHD